MGKKINPYQQKKKKKFKQSCFLLEALRGKSVSLSFLASSGHLYPLVCGPSFIFKHSLLSLFPPLYLLLL